MMVSIHNKPGKFDAIFFSPHLDDAVLSAGLEIANLVKEKKRVLLVTFFTTAYQAPSVDAQRFVTASQAQNPQDLFIQRCAEDINACQVLGATHLHLGLVDALFRLTNDGNALYSNFEQVFSGSISRYDQQLKSNLTIIMTAIQQKLAAPGAIFYAPLGIGGHIDHHLIFLCALAAKFKPLFWEDVPYQVYSDQKITRLVALAPYISLSTSKIISLATMSEKKQAAVACYSSQLVGLEKNGLSGMHYQFEKFYQIE